MDRVSAGNLKELEQKKFSWASKLKVWNSQKYSAFLQKNPILSFSYPGHRYWHQLRSWNSLSSQYHVILELWLCSELYLLESFSSFLANIMLSWALLRAAIFNRKLTRSIPSVKLDANNMFEIVLSEYHAHSINSLFIVCGPCYSPRMFCGPPAA